ncbi:hypothetical protein BDP27DRAFT_1332685 [Rhodocollybia butyracea]|uniref:Uncharacterized protein n=1 Tax=Rhodocollybia butyracea TaxID=206335 RepID=A0A9P5PLZ0_9AGAR|nr:hypothetical protein BDP27DRAFT_1332685 [Rhodocollybia butyracea]
MHSINLYMHIFLLVVFISMVPPAVSGKPVKPIAFAGTFIDKNGNPTTDGKSHAAAGTTVCKTRISKIVKELAPKLKLTPGRTAIDWKTNNYVDSTELVYFKLVGPPLCPHDKPCFGWSKAMPTSSLMGIYYADTTPPYIFRYRVIPYNKEYAGPTWEEEENRFLKEINPVKKWGLGETSAPLG